MKRQTPEQEEKQRVAPASAPQVKLDTPQQDSNWSESKKIKWIKDSSAILLKVFNTPE